MQGNAFVSHRSGAARSRVLGLSLAAWALISSVTELARADPPTHAGCELSSNVRAGSSDKGRLVETWAAFTPGVAYVAARPEDNSISLVVSAGDEFRELGLYWPTPRDPEYAYRRMSKLPYSTNLLGNDFDQTIIVVREPIELVVNGEKRTYRPIDYAGNTLGIDGCGGNDQLHGGDGNDHLYDYAGDNELRGYGGRDWLEGLGGYFSGGAGDDCVTADGGSSFTRIFGDEGDDVLQSVGARGTAQGGDGTDSCVATLHGTCEGEEPAVCLGWN